MHTARVSTRLPTIHARNGMCLGCARGVHVEKKSTRWFPMDITLAYRICVFLIRGGVNPAMPNDWYAILEVDPSATSSDIRSAYRKQALRSHPDRAQTDDKDQATAQFKLVAEYVFLDQGVY